MAVTFPVTASIAMTTISRRIFLANRQRFLSPPPAFAHKPAASTGTLAIPAEATGRICLRDFVGLSYEVQQLTDPTFFSGKNTGLIREFKALRLEACCAWVATPASSPIGGPTPDSPSPSIPAPARWKASPRPSITPSLRRRCATWRSFLKATGWTCLYGIGMGTNTPERAADEAEFVAKTLGPSLQYFQIGNEVDLFDRHLRDPKTWSAKTYLDEWLTLARAIAARVPGARFGMPDVAANIIVADANRRLVAFDPESAACHHAHASLLLRRAGDQPRGEHSQPAEAGDDGQGAEDGGHRDRRREQRWACACA